MRGIKIGPMISTRLTPGALLNLCIQSLKLCLQKKKAIPTHHMPSLKNSHSYLNRNYSNLSAVSDTCEAWVGEAEFEFEITVTSGAALGWAISAVAQVCSLSTAVVESVTVFGTSPYFFDVCYNNIVHVWKLGVKVLLRQKYFCKSIRTLAFGFILLLSIVLLWNAHHSNFNCKSNMHIVIQLVDSI